jgi:two-component system response regulator FixJ
MQNRPDVYIIDDDRAVRDALSFLLKSAGVTPHAYESATDFLEASDTLEPGCVITDVRMPEMDGLTLVRHIRDKGLRHPIVVITGHGDVPLAPSISWRSRSRTPPCSPRSPPPSTASSAPA